QGGAEIVTADPKRQFSGSILSLGACLPHSSYLSAPPKSRQKETARVGFGPLPGGESGARSAPGGDQRAGWRWPHPPLPAQGRRRHPPPSGRDWSLMSVRGNFHI